MRPFLMIFAFMSLLLSGGIFGFFYAWVCSTMWGLDTADPAVAIAAMQAMNGSVRNAVFAPAFFGTPVAMLITALLARRFGSQRAAFAFGAAAVLYFAGGLVLTMAINVPMNEALALIDIPQDPDVAAQIWQDYSAPWQFWNQARTWVSGAALMLVGSGLVFLNEGRGA